MYTQVNCMMDAKTSYKLHYVVNKGRNCAGLAISVLLTLIILQWVQNYEEKS